MHIFYFKDKGRPIVSCKVKVLIIRYQAVISLQEEPIFNANVEVVQDPNEKEGQ